MIKEALIVGASSGMGYEVARQLAESGTKVAVVARRLDRLEKLAEAYPGKVLCYSHDVTNFDEIPGLFQQITHDLGGLDLFLYASGVMPEVGWHEYSFGKDKPMIDVNIAGAVAWLNEAAERMDNTRHGRLVAIGSVAGERGRSQQPVYNASKAFLHTYMEAIRNRIARHGVAVVTIKPGPTETEMTAHLKMKKMPVEVAARKIIALSGKTGEHFLSPVHAVAFLIIRNFPSFIFRKLKV
jgi:NADP-dependent 3-hydroxy acid dehydrogenase YdfG